MKRHLTGAIVLACEVLAVSVAHAQEFFPEQPIDCVIRPREMIELASLDSGILTEILVDRGDMVEVGDVVARLESELQVSAVTLARMRAENDAAVDVGHARVDFRTAEMVRVKKLFDRRVASGSDLEEAKVELRLAELELDSAFAERRMANANLADAELRLMRREIRAAVAGLVVRVTGAPGEFASEQSEVLTIATLDPLHVEAYLPIALYPELEIGQQASIRIGKPLEITREATVSAIDRVFDAGSGTLGLRLDLPNPEGALPSGLKCGLRLATLPALQ